MRIAVIGYGEVGRILAEDLRREQHALVAYDAKLGSAAEAPLRDHAKHHGVFLAATAGEAVRDAELVFSVVTPNQAVVAASACGPALTERCFFLDLNSASPGAKIAAAEHVAGKRGRYVEGAVMTSVPPHRLRVPLLLGGPDAAALEPLLTGLGFAGDDHRKPRRGASLRR
jgi:3-hydroxyisobutyrate dehydrogenase-like beta-hydroxyacid dehydrogenase